MLCMTMHEMRQAKPDLLVCLSINVRLGGRGWTERQRGKPRGFGLAPSNPGHPGHNLPDKYR